MPLLAAQSKLLARLEAGNTGLTVRPAETMQAMVESKQGDKSLYVMLYRYRPVESDNGSARLWDEYWMTVVALKHVGGAERAERLRDSAGPYLNKIVALLDGWTARPEVLGRLEAVPGPDPLITDGYGYYPLLFKLQSLTEFAPDPGY